MTFPSIFLRNLSVFAMAALLLVSCGGGEPTKRRAVQDTLEVETQSVGLSRVAGRREFPGRVAAATQTQLSTRVMGTIERIRVEVGERVQKGQPLIEVRSQDIQAQVQQAEARIAEARAALQQAESDYQRIQNLYDKESATERELEQARAQYEMMQARLRAAEEARRQARESLNYARIAAPYSGRIIKKFMQEGQLASPGQPILALESGGKYEVVAQVSEEDINQFRTGDTVVVRLDALDRSLPGIVGQLNPSAQYTGAQFEIKVQLSPDELSRDLIKSGMFGHIISYRGEERGIYLPEDVLVRRGQLEGVYKLGRSGKALLQWVRTGRRTPDGRVEILSGLSPGDRIITEPMDGRLHDGALVQASDASITNR
jgi:RND family efflux transporter MFP subunit